MSSSFPEYITKFQKINHFLHFNKHIYTSFKKSISWTVFICKALDEHTCLFMNNETNRFTFASSLPIAFFLAYHSFLYIPEVNSICRHSVWTRDSHPNSCCSNIYNGKKHIGSSFCKLTEEKKKSCVS